MKDLPGFTPRKKPLDAVFESNSSGSDDADNPWMQTSLKLRLKTRSQIKAYAALNSLTMQDVIETALSEYLEKHQ